MRVLIVILFTFQFAASANYIVSSNISKNQKWSSVTADKSVNIQILLSYLARSKTGRKIILAAKVKAAEQGKKLLEVLGEGHSSLTDTTLYRKFSKEGTGSIEYETKSVVKINQDLSQFDALLDLAHELTHFVYRDEFNPYRLDFTLKKFIQSTIEDTGGEVHAFMTECKVLKELFPNDLKARRNCQKITDEEDTLSYQHAVDQFYSVGDYYKNLKVNLHKYELGRDFNRISNSSIKFISSAYGVPYPVAAMHEYNTVMKKVCENDINRYAALKKNKQQRSIASVSSFKDSILKRCRLYL